MPNSKLVGWSIVFTVLVLAGCYDLNSPSLPNPPLSKEKGLVVLFAGWTPPGTSVVGTGMYEVTQELRAIGVRAETHTPDDWQAAATELAKLPGAADLPIATVGYSLGAAGATKFAEALKQATIPVQTLVVIEAWSPVPIACNVRKAVDIFNSDSFLSLSSRLQPGPGFVGTLEPINYSAITADKYGLNHWTISMVDDIHRLVRARVLDGDHVRRYPPPAGTEACRPGGTSATR